MAESALPDELIHEIFLRLHDDGDVFALFCCALTCKRWRRLVAGSFFLRRRWPSSLLGFFASPADADTCFAVVPTGRSEEAAALYGGHPSHRRLSSFVCDAPVYLDHALPLVSRGSFLLVRLFSGDHDPERDVACLGLAMCDLLAGTSYLLPKLDCDSRFNHNDDYYYGYAILSSRAGDYPPLYSDDDDRLSPTFRVLMIGQDKHEATYNLHVFTSGEHGWSAAIECFNIMEHQVSSMMHANAVVCRGSAHWLFSNSLNFHVLSFDAETRQISLTKLLSPIPHNLLDDGVHAIEVAYDSPRGLFHANRLTTTADGTLLTLCVYRSEGCRLEMWTRQEDDGERQSGGGDAEWRRTRVKELRLDDLKLQRHQPSPICTCLGERSGTLLILDHRCRFYIADLETGALEEVTHQFPGHAYNRIVPVEIDWPTFPDRWA